MPTRGVEGLMQWSMTAQRLAIHSPYFLVFGHSFIEVRHIESGNLVRILSGNDIRCIWDGLNTTSSFWVSNETRNTVTEPWFHAVMNHENSSPDSGLMVQHLFALTPTLPFYNPSVPHTMASSPSIPDLPLQVSRPNRIILWANKNTSIKHRS